MKKEHYSSLKQFLHFTYFNDGQNNSAKQVVQFFNWIEENEKLINKKII